MTGDLHFYYLHTNGALIHKRAMPEADSPFVRKIWPFRTDERESGYVLLTEAAALGADMKRILELAKLWGMDGTDGLIFCDRMGFVCNPHESEAGNGFLLWHRDDDEQRSRGEGSSPLLALISYTKQGDFAKGAANAYS